MMNHAAHVRDKIGFLVKTYPKLSEGFILQEIIGLERLALPLQLFSLNHPEDDVFHSHSAKVTTPVTYVPRFRGREALTVVSAHAGLINRSPRRYLGALWFVLRRSEHNRVREFVQAGCLAAYLRGAGITHLHAHFISEPAGVAELVNKLTGITFSISAHAKDIYLSSHKTLRRKIMNARFTVTCTDHNRQYLTSITDADETIYRMYHGIDLDILRSDRPMDGDANDEMLPLILSVGRLREKKGLPVLLQACRQLLDAGLAFRCEIVGYGPEHQKLLRLIATLKLQGTVELVGKLSHEDVIERYRGATVFILPCQVAEDGDRDGIPNVLLEAMGMRLPVVSTPVSGIPEVVRHYINGLLVPPRDPVSLADALRTLLEQPDLRRRLGDAGRTTVAGMFSSDTNLRKIAGLLQGVGCNAVDTMPCAEIGKRFHA